jgi:hypothetical protein
MRVLLTEAARLAESRDLQIKEIAHLGQQIRGCQLLHERENEQIEEIRMALVQLCRGISRDWTPSVAMQTPQTLEAVESQEINLGFPGGIT